MLQWNENFRTGHPQIDSEHQMLIGFVNRLEETARITNPTRPEIELILSLVDSVQAYTVVHFQHEETCMAQHQCPAFAENKSAHAEFLQQFQHFKERFRTEGCRPGVVQDLHDLCSIWVQQHILKIDTQLKRCLASSPEGE